jgi:hypothetical protein
MTREGGRAWALSFYYFLLVLSYLSFTRTPPRDAYLAYLICRLTLLFTTTYSLATA